MRGASRVCTQAIPCDCQLNRDSILIQGLRYILATTNNTRYIRQNDVMPFLRQTRSNTPHVRARDILNSNVVFAHRDCSDLRCATAPNTGRSFHLRVYCQYGPVPHHPALRCPLGLARRWTLERKQRRFTLCRCLGSSPHRTRLSGVIAVMSAIAFSS